MADKQGLTFDYKVKYTGIGDANVFDEVSAAEIEEMTMPEFLAFQGQLMNVRRRKRYDYCFLDNNVAFKRETKMEIFRKGIGEGDFSMNNVAYTKIKGHTNMKKGGNFGENTLTIVHAIEVEFDVTARKATTYAANLPVNPLAVAALANQDAILLHNMVKRQVEIAFKREDTTIIDGPIEDFPCNTGGSGFAGATEAVLIQNVGPYLAQLNNPMVFVNQDDFSVQVQLLTDIDLSAAAGLNYPVALKVNLHTIELRRVYP